MGKKERKKKMRRKKEGEGKFAGVQNQQRKSGKERGNKRWLFLGKKKKIYFQNFDIATFGIGKRKAIERKMCNKEKK